MKETINLFQQLIFKTKLNYDLNKLKKFSLNLEKKHKGRKLSNVGGFQSNNLDLNIKELNNLIKDFIFLSNEAGKFFKIKNTLQIKNLWININRYKDFNSLHNHPFSIFSGAFYIKTPNNCGNIVFKNEYEIENFLTKDMVSEENIYNSSSWFLPVKENVLYIFPSWLKHYVEPNLSKEDRISISFNINL